MATPVENPAPQSGPEGAPGAPESGTPAPEAQPPAGAPPAGTETPPPAAHGLPGAPAPDGVITSGRGSNQDAAPQTPAAPAATPSPTEPQGTPATPPAGTGGQQVEDLPDWAQKIIKDARDDAAKARVNAKQSAADEARKALTNDIAKALGIVTDDTPAEDQLTPEQLRDLLAGERSTAKMARVELAVYRTAQGGANFNAAALLDSRAFLDSIKDIDPSDNEALATKIAEAVQAQPWLATQAPPAVDPAATTPPGAPAPVTPGAAPAAPVQPPAPQPVVVPPSGGQFAGGPGAQPQDLSSMSIDDFRRLRRSPRS